MSCMKRIRKLWKEAVVKEWPSVSKSARNVARTFPDSHHDVLSVAGKIRLGKQRQKIR